MFSVKRPVICNGRLQIMEKEVGVNLIWDNEVKDYLKVPDISIVVETVNLIAYIRIYNHLLDYWFSKTGELLHDYIDESVKVDWTCSTTNRVFEQVH